MPFGNSAGMSRRDNVRIAQRFNAGWHGWIVPSPGATAEPRIGNPVFCRPFGTQCHSCLHPALKRWAIFGCPSGTNFSPNSRKALALKAQDRAHAIILKIDPDRGANRRDVRAAMHLSSIVSAVGVHALACQGRRNSLKAELQLDSKPSSKQRLRVVDESEHHVNRT